MRQGRVNWLTREALSLPAIGGFITCKYQASENHRLLGSDRLYKY